MLRTDATSPLTYNQHEEPCVTNQHARPVKVLTFNEVATSYYETITRKQAEQEEEVAARRQQKNKEENTPLIKTRRSFLVRQGGTRVRFSEDVIKTLTNFFDNSTEKGRATRDELAALAAETGLKTIQAAKWLDNHRRRTQEQREFYCLPLRQKRKFKQEH